MALQKVTLYSGYKGNNIIKKEILTGSAFAFPGRIN